MVTTSKQRAALELMRDALSAPRSQQLTMVSGAAALWVINELAGSEVSIGFVETHFHYTAVVVGDRVEQICDDRDVPDRVFTDIEVSPAGNIVDFAVNGYRVSDAIQAFAGGDHRATLTHTRRLGLIVWPPSMLEPSGWRARSRRANVIGRVGVTTGSVSHRIVWSSSFRRGRHLAGAFSFPDGSTADEDIREFGGFELHHGDDSFSFSASPWTPEWSQGWPERPEPATPIRHRRAIVAAITEFSDAFTVLDKGARETIVRQISDQLPLRPTREDLAEAVARTLTDNGLK